jgi:hypothetical protein
MKTLIAVATCHPYLVTRADNQRFTWVEDSEVDVRFFVGKPHAAWVPDYVVQLDCPDSYEHRKAKVKAIFRWALEHGYERLIKIDDDVYLRPERLASLPEMDYGGFRITQQFFWDGIYLYTRPTTLGAFYVISKHAMGLLLGPDLHTEIRFEDLWVSLQLKSKGIGMVDLRPRLGYCLYDSVPPPPDFTHQEQPLASNNVVASWEYRTFSEMVTAHNMFTVG